MKTIGILGQGQLAQLLTHAAFQLGLKTRPLTQDEPTQNWLDEVDALTFEHEHIDIEWLKTLPIKPLPTLKAFDIAQDRLKEKSFFNQIDIPTVAFCDGTLCQPDFPFPAILKTCQGGYDGKGQQTIESFEALQPLLKDCQPGTHILEAYCDFDFEVSIISARDTHSAIVHYPLVKNDHQAGILRQSTFPFSSPTLNEQAQKIAESLLESLDYVGVCAIEFFVSGDKLIANEWAPRVHNSGHLTIEACQVSQFENHLRAVSGMHIVMPKVLAPATMQNIIGTWPADLDHSAGHIYNYGKSPRPGRKLGHCVTLQE